MTPIELPVEHRGIPHLAKNERDVGHPSLCCLYRRPVILARRERFEDSQRNLPAVEVFWTVNRLGHGERGEALRAGRAILPGFLLCLLTIVRVHRADGQLETSQVPVQATVSSEPVGMQAAAPPEGLIHLDVAARDREGRPFSGLAAKDFTLMDDGVAQKIVSFEMSHRATDENEQLTEVVLVLDEVNLSNIQFELVKGESIKFLRANG
jgi:hypothetical protein